MARIGTTETRLVVLRGPSGSGKSSTARALRERLGRSVALIEQDYLRRVVLKERDVPGAANIDLIAQTARFALDRGWNVILEGILLTEHYASMLDDLRHDHVGRTWFYYFDISWGETVRRHRTRPKANEFGVEDMRQWYRRVDPLAFADECVISEALDLDATVARILDEAFSPSSVGGGCPGVRPSDRVREWGHG